MDTLFEGPPPELVVDMIRYIRYDDLITLSTVIPTVRQILHSIPLMRRLVSHSFISDYQEVITRDYRLYQLHRLHLRYQTVHNKQYSIGSELFTPIHKVITFAHFHHLHTMKRHLNNILYSPAAICRALGRLGDRDRCLSLIGSVEELERELTYHSVLGAVEGDHYELYDELTSKLWNTMERYYVNKMLNKIVSLCLKHQRVKILNLIVGGSSLDDDMIDEDRLCNYLDVKKPNWRLSLRVLDVIDGDIRCNTPYTKLIRAIRSNNLNAVSNRLTFIPAGVIRSVEMRDLLLARRSLTRQVVISLLLTLDGTQGEGSPFSLLSSMTYWGWSIDEFIGLYRGRHLSSAVKEQITQWIDVNAPRGFRSEISTRLDSANGVVSSGHVDAIMKMMVDGEIVRGYRDIIPEAVPDSEWSSYLAETRRDNLYYDHDHYCRCVSFSAYIQDVDIGDVTLSVEWMPSIRNHVTYISYEIDTDESLEWVYQIYSLANRMGEKHDTFRGYLDTYMHTSDPDSDDDYDG